MNNKVKLSDIELRTLSTEVLNLISKIAIMIRQHSGKTYQFNDPDLLKKISYKYKKIDDPELNQLYKQYKNALKRSLSGHYQDIMRTT